MPEAFLRVRVPAWLKREENKIEWKKRGRFKKGMKKSRMWKLSFRLVIVGSFLTANKLPGGMEKGDKFRKISPLDPASPHPAMVFVLVLQFSGLKYIVYSQR